jgi:serine/threonine-protein kinase
VVIALLVFAITRSKRFSPQKLIDLGLIFEVCGGFGISFVEHWALFGDKPFDGFGISWVCIWIVFYPLIVPSTPGKAFLAALLTASTGILAFTLSVAFGKSIPPPAPDLIQLFLPSYVSAVVAFLAAKVIYKLGTDVKEARRMGAYELVERLGVGGMGEVWQARHRFLSRPAAIKLMRPEVFGELSGLHVNELQRRFEREAEATAALRSPHSIVLYDFGTTETGVFYYVMELLSGVNLQDLVTRFGPVPPDRTMHLLKQACHSLMDAHTNGLIHRDIKPANIYLCRLGPDADFIKVLDFGLVKMQPRSGDPSSTTAGVISGTPGYMAPEVVFGAGEFEPRSDIFSLGCVAYWLLTGQLAFEGETQKEVLEANLTSDPTPLSAHGELDIPKPLEELVMSCLSRKPDNRVESASALLRALETMTQLSPWTNKSAEKWWDTHLPRAAEARATIRVGAE